MGNTIAYANPENHSGPVEARMNVTFINPAVPWDMLDATWIRHGIAQLSACCKQAGHETRLIDCRRILNFIDNEPVIEWNLFDQKLVEHCPDVFAVSVLSPNMDFARKAIERIRVVHPGVPVIAGGIGVTVDPQGAKKLGADVRMTGEGETALVYLLDQPWIDSPSNGARMLWPTEVSGSSPQLDSLPYADRKLFKPYGEQPIGDLPRPFHTILIGRGCPHRCAYCAPAEQKVFGKKVRMRGVPHVMGELKELQRDYGLASFLIHDDCFSAFPAYAQEFADVLRSELPGVSWYCQARADHIVRKPELFERLRDAGLKGCLVGFESGSNRVLSYLKKDVTREENEQAAGILAQLGITVWANLMVGIPTETQEEVLETVAFAKKVRDLQPKALFSWAMFTPIPGSELYEECERLGINLIKKSEDFRRYFDASKPKISGVDYGWIKKSIEEGLA